MTVSFVGIEEGVEGRGFMKAEGVCGGSIFGATFFHASTKVESSVDGSSVEKARVVTDLEDAAATDRERRREACLNMAAIWWWW